MGGCTRYARLGLHCMCANTCQLHATGSCRRLLQPGSSRHAAARSLRAPERANPAATARPREGGGSADSSDTLGNRRSASGIFEAPRARALARDGTRRSQPDGDARGARHKVKTRVCHPRRAASRNGKVAARSRSAAEHESRRALAGRAAILV